MPPFYMYHNMAAVPSSFPQYGTPTAIIQIPPVTNAHTGSNTNQFPAAPKLQYGTGSYYENLSQVGCNSMLGFIVLPFLDLFPSAKDFLLHFTVNVMEVQCMPSLFICLSAHRLRTSRLVTDQRPRIRTRLVEHQQAQPLIQGLNLEVIRVTLIK